MYSLTNGDILLCTNSNPIKNLDTSIFDNDYEIDYIYTKNIYIFYYINIKIK